MKMIIESLENGDAKLTLNFKGKDYSETWVDTGSEYCTIDGNIIDKLEQDDITAEDTDIDDMLTNIDVFDFMSLANREEEW